MFNEIPLTIDDDQIFYIRKNISSEKQAERYVQLMKINEKESDQKLAIYEGKKFWISRENDGKNIEINICKYKDEKGPLIVIMNLTFYIDASMKWNLNYWVALRQYLLLEQNELQYINNFCDNCNEDVFEKYKDYAKEYDNVKTYITNTKDNIENNDYFKKDLIDKNIKELDKCLEYVKGLVFYSKKQFLLKKLSDKEIINVIEKKIKVMKDIQDTTDIYDIKDKLIELLEIRQQSNLLIFLIVFIFIIFLCYLLIYLD